MSDRAELFLGIIAAATLITAILQVGVLVAAGLLARRLQRLIGRAEAELKPLFDHLNAIGRDASRAASLATAKLRPGVMPLPSRTTRARPASSAVEV